VLSKPLPASVKRRQDAPRVFDMNASIYVYKTTSLLSMSTLWDLSVKLFEMPDERSIDIDREIDFKIVELIMKQRNERL
jgi:CMP-N,N'-diacetyllegionaminic acid synthase